MFDRSRWQRDIASMLCPPCISLDSIGRGMTNENLVYFTCKNKQHLAKVFIKLGNLESRGSVKVTGEEHAQRHSCRVRAVCGAVRGAGADSRRCEAGERRVFR